MDLWATRTLFAWDASISNRYLIGVILFEADAIGCPIFVFLSSRIFFGGGGIMVIIGSE